MGKMAQQHPDWEYVDWMDLHPGVGSFVSPTYDDYEVHGTIIRALNWLHAEYTWLHREVERSGESWSQCCHCNKYIRYAVIFKDAGGFHHMVGQECARFISSNLDRNAWDEKRKLSNIKEIETKIGTRHLLTIDVPFWFWDVHREKRPPQVQLRKLPGRGRSNPSKWVINIWGDSPHEVLRAWEALMAMKKVIQ